jgi:LysM repeat protein
MSAEVTPAGRDNRHSGSRRGPGRLLAPLALLGVVVAVIVIIADVGGGSSPSSAPAVLSSTTATHHAGRTTTRGQTSTQGQSATTATDRTTDTTTTGVTSTVGTYTIASGDTFSVIAEKTGVPVATLEALNPGVSSSALTVGQVIKLK